MSSLFVGDIVGGLTPDFSHLGDFLLNTSKKVCA